MFSSTTRASFLSFFAFSSAAVGASFAVNAICCELGDHLKLVTSDFVSVICTMALPAGVITQILRLPDFFDRNAICLPSGDHCGSSHDWSPVVNCVAPVPSAFTEKMCERY